MKDSMDFLPTQSLFRRYLRVCLLCMTLLLLVLFLIFEVFIVRYKTEERVVALSENVSNISGSIENVVESNPKNADLSNSVLIIANMLNISSSSIEADVFVADQDGTVLFCGEQVDNNLILVSNDVCEKHQAMLVPQNVRTATTEDGNYAISEIDTLSSSRIIIVGNSIEYQNESIGYVYAIAPYYSTISAFATQIGLLFIGAAILAFFLAFLMAYFLAKRQAAPLQQMALVTRQYAQGDFSERIEVKGSDELAQLAGALNEMADALSILEESRQNFVANVSHELKTPMTTIGGFIDGILDGTIPQKDQKKYLKIVSKEVRRLSTLVVTMLTLSKIEAGEEKLHYSDTNLRQMLFQALLSFEKAIEEKGYTIKGFDTMPNIKAQVDEKMLFQVAYNLFDNAVKFTNPGGVIRVDMSEQEGKVLIAVSNTGKGIPKEELNRVFERFYKLDKSRSEHVKGVGLGLNLARNIVRLHGGELTARNVPEQYTTFSFWVPKTPPAQN